jgi:hypothetical protein
VPAAGAGLLAIAVGAGLAFSSSLLPSLSSSVSVAVWSESLCDSEAAPSSPSSSSPRAPLRLANTGASSSLSLSDDDPNGEASPSLSSESDEWGSNPRLRMSICLCRVMVPCATVQEMKRNRWPPPGCWLSCFYFILLISIFQAYLFSFLSGSRDFKKHKQDELEKGRTRDLWLPQEVLHLPLRSCSRSSYSFHVYAAISRIYAPPRFWALRKFDSDG